MFVGLGGGVDSYLIFNCQRLKLEHKIKQEKRQYNIRGGAREGLKPPVGRWKAIFSEIFGIYSTLKTIF